MKKLTFSVVVALSGLYGTAEAQVGINTALPAASLDITAKNTTGNSPTVDGVLIPRVDRQRAQSMIGVPASTLLYVNSVATGTQLGTAVNIDSIGYYYFDGLVWVKLYNPTNATYALGNIYTTSGTLNSNRVVNQATFPLTFTNSLVNGFSVGGSTFSVDALNSRVGIGTAAPHAQLHLGSTLANRKIVLYETGDNDNEFYGFGVNSGIMRYQADRTTTDHVFYAGLTGGAGSNELMRIKGTGNVGIGTSAPENRFQVVSATAVSNRYTLFDAPSAGNQFVITALRNTSPIATGNYALLGFTNAGPTSGGAAWGMGSIRTGALGLASEEEFMLGNSLGGGYLERIRVTSAGRVGIGTSTPSASAILDVASTSSGLLMPRMNSGQMNAIATPAAGLQVYNTDENCTFLFNGTNWRSLCARTFQQSSGGAVQVAIGSSSDLTQTISLAGTQNVTVQVSFNPQTFTNGVDANAVGTYQILIDGLVVGGNLRYSTQNAGNFLYRYSSVGNWTTTLAPGSHTIIFRVNATGGNVNTNAEDRRMIITVN
ncbi:hypothetical protein [Chryseobacterium sp. ERMR1:04]|uniref:hypothetical protein n=1 Tax=Chryseobacterium sp. ERMR1:04 TaxID=1705393 RepID=UPI0006C8718A|nr:hypothetical protein [Chryseobacterium sp. ERMR1:04]